MSCESEYIVGQLRRSLAKFKNSAKALTDPTVVVYKYRAPSATTTTTLVYGVDGALVRESVGVYHVDVSLTESGTWKERWQSTGIVQAASQGEFGVEASNL